MQLAAPRNVTRRAIRDTRSDRVFALANNALLTGLMLLVLYPLVYVVSASFSDPIAVSSGRVWLLPIEPTLVGYEAILKNKLLVTGFANSAFYTIAGTAISVVLTILAAYPLSRVELPGRRFLTFAFYFTMLFSGGMIATYIVVRQLGMVNTRLAMLLPNALSIFNLLVMRTYFQHNIPAELHEAAQLDGCSEFTYLRRIVLPLSKPIVVVVALFYAVDQWNTYFTALVYLHDRALWPLQLVLREVVIQNKIDPTMLTGLDPLQLAIRSQLSQVLKFSLIVVAALPMLIAYPFVQRHFVKGVLLGSVKG